MQLVERDRKLVRFHIPPEARWNSIATIATGIGQYLTDATRAVARENPRLQGIIKILGLGGLHAQE